MSSALVSNFFLLFSLPYCLALLIVVVKIKLVLVVVKIKLVIVIVKIKLVIVRIGFARIALDRNSIVRTGLRNAEKFRYAVGVYVDARTGEGVAFFVEQHYYVRSQTFGRSHFLLIHVLLIHFLDDVVLLSHHRTQTDSESCPHKCKSR